MDDRRVHYERLHQAKRQHWRVRLCARAFCHSLVGLFHIATSLMEQLMGRRLRRKLDRPARVVVTGTFFADNWVESHIRPIALSEFVEHLWVVSDRRFVPMDRVTYVCPPHWLQKLAGRVISRSLMFAWVAAWRRADVVGGFHLLCNGLLALTVARMVRARAMYFCVGGWAEFVQGGVHGGNRIFTLMARDDAPLERALLRAIRKFDLILTMGTGARQFLLSQGISAPVHVMPGGIDPAFFHTDGGTPKYDLVTVSRIVPVKRLDVFLEALRQVADNVPTVTAAVVGDGDQLESLKHRAAELGLSQHVEFVGRQSNVPRWLTDARIFVLTSDSEGLSLALMEAMMAGLPGVVSDVGDLGDLVVDGVNGWRPAPRDVSGFASRITALLTDPEHYRRFATHARQAGARYTVEAMRQRWDDILAGWVHPAGLRRTHEDDNRTPRYLPSPKDLWERSSRFTRRPPARILSAVSPSFWLGSRFREKLRFVERTERWDREEASAYQLGELRRVVSHAYHRSPYYRRLYRECGFEPGDLKSLDDVTRLPTVDGRTIHEHLRSVCTVQRIGPRLDRASTGGTGGKPLQFFIDVDRSATEYAYLVAGWRRAGYEIGAPLAVFRGRIVPMSGSGLHYEYDPLMRHHYYSSFHLTDEQMQRYLDHVRGIGPCFLHVYPSSVAALARYVRRSSSGPPGNIRGIIAESEIVYPDQRRMVEEAFGCRYFSCYGHTEKLVAAAECEHSTDYHVWPTYGYFELLDPYGRAVTEPGQRGEIVGTGFINTVTPFIRYRTGDFATYVSDRCKACGRQQPILTDIRGHRTQELLLASDGSEISWTSLNMHDDTFLHVRQFQFGQHAPGRAVLRIVPADGFGDDDRRRIEDSLQRKLDHRIDVTIELTASIDATRSGKAIYVDRVT